MVMASYWKAAKILLSDLTLSSMEVYILGMKNTGKSSLVQKLNKKKLGNGGRVMKLHDFDKCSPWIEAKHLIYDKMTLRSIITHSDGIVYVIDASNNEQFAESKKALVHICIMINALNVSRPILILGNKNDKMEFMIDILPEQTQKKLFWGFIRVYAVNMFRLVLPDAICALCLQYYVTESIPNTQGVQYEFHMCSVTKEYGYLDGIRWLADNCKNERSRSFNSDGPKYNRVNESVLTTAVVTI